MSDLQGNSQKPPVDEFAPNLA